MAAVTTFLSPLPPHSMPMYPYVWVPPPASPLPPSPYQSWQSYAVPPYPTSVYANGSVFPPSAAFAPPPPPPPPPRLPPAVTHSPMATAAYSRISSSTVSASASASTMVSSAPLSSLPSLHDTESSNGPPHPLALKSSTSTVRNANKEKDPVVIHVRYEFHLFGECYKGQFHVEDRCSLAFIPYCIQSRTYKQSRVRSPGLPSLAVVMDGVLSQSTKQYHGKQYEIHRDQTLTELGWSSNVDVTLSLCAC